MADDKSIHLYGGSDPTDDTPPTSEGFRGEGAPDGDRPEQRRSEMLSDGRTVEVEEESGIAYAESQGAGQSSGASGKASDPQGAKPQV